MKHTNELKTASDIVALAGGTETICQMFGVKERVVFHHRKIGLLPAKWFSRLEYKTGQTLPRHLFSFI